MNSATDAFTHLADNDAALANENATRMAEQLPGIPMLTIGVRHLIAPETYAEVRDFIEFASKP